MATNEERITKCETKIEGLENNNVKIWKQVSNEIPHQIMAFDEKNDRDHSHIYNKLDANAKENRNLSFKIIFMILGLFVTIVGAVIIQNLNK